MSSGSPGDYQADERQVSGAQLAIIKQMSGRCRVAQVAIIKQMSGQVSQVSAGDYQADERTVIVRLSCRLSSRLTGRCREAQLAIIKQSKPPAAAAAKSLQSCPTLCDPIDDSPPGSLIPGILQARTLEWVAISSPTHESEK